MPALINNVESRKPPPSVESDSDSGPPPTSVRPVVGKYVNSRTKTYARESLSTDEENREKEEKNIRKKERESRANRKKKG